MDPVHGELSRAMRNRGVEIYIPGEHEAVCWDTLDMKTLLHTEGVAGDCVCDLLLEIHKSIKSAIWGEFPLTYSWRIVTHCCFKSSLEWLFQTLRPRPWPPSCTPPPCWPASCRGAWTCRQRYSTPAERHTCCASALLPHRRYLQIEQQRLYFICLNVNLTHSCVFFLSY